MGAHRAPPCSWPASLSAARTVSGPGTKLMNPRPGLGTGWAGWLRWGWLAALTMAHSRPARAIVIRKGSSGAGPEGAGAFKDFRADSAPRTSSFLYLFRKWTLTF
jgi:hypothetical protein